MQTYKCFYLPLQENNNLKSKFELPLVAYTFVLNFAKFFEVFKIQLTTNKLKICYLKIYNTYTINLL